MNVAYLLVLSILAGAAFLTVKLGKLTICAAVAGWVIGFLLFLAASYAGILMMAAFFVMGTIATSWRMSEKRKAGLAENNKGRRTTGQVLANGGLAGLLSLVALMFPGLSHILILMIAAGFSSATADTLSSELGNVYGSKFYNILTWKKDTRGLDGVVSIEGTLIGVAGSTVIAGIYALYFAININVLIMIVAGTIGNISDSLLGATLERSRHLNNNAVNFFNTCVAAIAAIIMYAMLHS